MYFLLVKGIFTFKKLSSEVKFFILIINGIAPAAGNDDGVMDAFDVDKNRYVHALETNFY